MPPSPGPESPRTLSHLSLHVPNSGEPLGSGSVPGQTGDRLGNYLHASSPDCFFVATHHLQRTTQSVFSNVRNSSFSFEQTINKFLDFHSCAADLGTNRSFGGPEN